MVLNTMKLMPLFAGSMEVKWDCSIFSLMKLSQADVMLWEIFLTIPNYYRGIRVSMLNSSGSELERIRCRKCGCVFVIEGMHIGITTNRFFVPQMGNLKERRYKNENEVQAQIQCPHCGQKIVTTINY